MRRMLAVTRDAVTKGKGLGTMRWVFGWQRDLLRSTEIARCCSVRSARRKRMG